VSVIKTLQAEGQPVLVVDSGDLFFDAAIATANLSKARVKAKVIARAYNAVGITAINVGEGDLLAGVKFLQRGIGQRLPFISANLIDPARKKPIFTPFVIQKVSGVRIAFFGLVNPSIASAIKQGKAEEVIVADPVETARQVVRGLTGKADLIILLSDLGVDEDTRIHSRRARRALCQVAIPGRGDLHRPILSEGDVCGKAYPYYRENGGSLSGRREGCVHTRKTQ
jgi:5'-nucleotidase/UDP-sugar diphosphatase